MPIFLLSSTALYNYFHPHSIDLLGRLDLVSYPLPFQLRFYRPYNYRYSQLNFLTENFSTYRVFIAYQNAFFCVEVPIYFIVFVHITT